MGEGEVHLTPREADRAAVIREVAERRVRQSEAARRLGLSVRQVKPLVRRRERGAAGLASERRGGPSNNPIDARSAACGA